MKKYCVICKKTWGPHMTKCCTDDSLIATKLPGLFRKKQLYFDITGMPLNEIEIETLRKKEAGKYNNNQAQASGTIATSTGASDNLVRWIAAGHPVKWVKKHLGQWNHNDWLVLLESLRRSEFWPLEEAAVGRTLEAEKIIWQTANTSKPTPEAIPKRMTTNMSPADGVAVTGTHIEKNVNKPGFNKYGERTGMSDDEFREITRGRRPISLEKAKDPREGLMIPGTPISGIRLLVVKSETSNLFGAAMITLSPDLLLSVDGELAMAGRVSRGQFIEYINAFGYGEPRFFEELSPSTIRHECSLLFPGRQWCCCGRKTSLYFYNFVICF